MTNNENWNFKTVSIPNENILHISIVFLLFVPTATVHSIIFNYILFGAHLNMFVAQSIGDDLIFFLWQILSNNRQFYVYVPLVNTNRVFRARKIFIRK